MPFAELETDATLHYVDSNPDDANPPILLIHGRLGTPEWDFGEVMPWLERDYRIIAPCLRGYGQSKPHPRVFPYDFYQKDAQDMLALMDALNLERVHVLGYSDGGEAALLMAGTAPERLISVATIGAVGYYGPAMRPVVQANFPATWITAEDKLMHGITNPDAFALGWIKAVKRIIDSGGDLSMSLAQNMTMPLLMMLGDKDMLNPAEYAQRIVERAPDARLEMFDTGHGVHQQDLEGFKRVFGQHLKRVADNPTPRST